MTLIIKHPPGRDLERQYIFEVIFGEFLGIEYDATCDGGSDVRITNSDDNGSSQLTVADIFLSTVDDQWLQPDSLPRRPLAVWDTPVVLRALNTRVPLSVPVIYGRINSARAVRDSSEFHLDLDVFGSSFFMLTRYEELVQSERDSFDRFPSDASLAVQEGFLERPVVNEYLEILWAALLRLWPDLKRRQQRYRVELSHDVDVVSLKGSSLPGVLLRTAKDLLQRREPKLAARRMKAYIGTMRHKDVVECDPYNSFDFIMDISERFGLKDAFYFIAGRTNRRRDATYEVDEPFIRRLIRRIHEREHEVGFHASFETYQDAVQTGREVTRLKQVCSEENVEQNEWGGRQHYLRWQNPVTWQNWEDSGLDYDSSLSFADRAGFRTGCCYEYTTMNLRTRKRLRLRERPLIAMECSLLTYRGCSLSETEEALGRLAGTCYRFGGTFTLLWHNHMLVSRTSQQAYARIVEAAASRS